MGLRKELIDYLYEVDDKAIVPEKAATKILKLFKKHNYRKMVVLDGYWSD